MTDISNRLPWISGYVEIGTLNIYYTSNRYSYQLRLLTLIEDVISVYDKSGARLLDRYVVKDGTEIRELYSRPRREIDFISPNGTVWLHLRTKPDAFDKWIRLLRVSSMLRRNISFKRVLSKLLRLNHVSKVEEEERKSYRVLTLQDIRQRVLSKTLKSSLKPSLKPSSSWERVSSSFECDVCLSFKSNGIRICECLHVFCAECWYRCFEISIREGRVSTKLTCLRDSCSERVPSSLILTMIEGSTNLLKRYEQMLVISYIDNHRNTMVWCPNCHEQRVIEILKDDDDDLEYTSCHVVSCSSSCTKFCFYCLCADHEPAPCSIAKSWFDRKISLIEKTGGKHVVANLQSKAWVRMNCRHCPGCSVPIWKDPSQEGCIRMKCLKDAGGCGFEFCWWCMKPWHGGPYFGEGGRPGESRPCRFYYAQRREKKRSSFSSLNQSTNTTTTTTTKSYERFAATVETILMNRREHITSLKTSIQQTFKHSSKKHIRESMYHTIQTVDRCWSHTIWIRIMLWSSLSSSSRHHFEDARTIFLRLILVYLHYAMEDLIREIESPLNIIYHPDTSTMLQSHVKKLRKKSLNLSTLMCQVRGHLAELVFYDNDDIDHNIENQKKKNTKLVLCLCCGISREPCCAMCYSVSSLDSSIESFVRRSIEFESSIIAVLQDEKTREDKIRTKISDRTTQQEKVWIPGTCIACTFHNNAGAARCVICSTKISSSAPRGWRVIE